MQTTYKSNSDGSSPQTWIILLNFSFSVVSSLHALLHGHFFLHYSLKLVVFLEKPTDYAREWLVISLERCGNPSALELILTFLHHLYLEFLTAQLSWGLLAINKFITRNFFSKKDFSKTPIAWRLSLPSQEALINWETIFNISYILFSLKTFPDTQGHYFCRSLLPEICLVRLLPAICKGWYSPPST